jgi:hypothetical protein
MGPDHGKCNTPIEKLETTRIIGTESTMKLPCSHFFRLTNGVCIFYHSFQPNIHILTSLTTHEIDTTDPRIRHRIKFIEARRFSDVPRTRATARGEAAMNAPVRALMAKKTV